MIRYFEPTGAVDLGAMAAACGAVPFPAVPRDRGFFAFGTTEEINEAFVSTGKFRDIHIFDLLKFISDGAPDLDLKGKDASNRSGRSG